MDLFRNEMLDARKHSLFGDVVLDQPLSATILTSIMAAMAVATFAYLAVGHYTRTETVPGFVASPAASAQILALRAGVVTKLNVRDGDQVRAGQAIATIRIGEATPESQDPAADAQASISQQIEILQGQAAIEQGRRIADQSKLASGMKGYVQGLASLDVQINLQRDIVRSAEQGVQQLETLLIKGFASKFETERRRSEYLTAQQQYQQLEQQRSQILTQMESLRSDAVRLPLDTRTRVGDIQSNIQNLRQRIGEDSAARSYVVVAPLSGRISALQTSVGHVANPALPLMTVLPDGAELVGELYAPSRAAGFIRVGQRVRLLYDAFPFQRFGSFGATVESVSQTVILPHEIDAPIKLNEPAYRLRVRLDRQNVAAFGQRLALRPGMSLTAHIQLDRRSFIDWLLEPLRAAQARAS